MRAVSIARSRAGCPSISRYWLVTSMLSFAFCGCAVGLERSKSRSRRAARREPRARSAVLVGLNRSPKRRRSCTVDSVANEALVKSVKDIAAASKAGDTEAAYHGYRDLFASEAFAGYRVEDQRQALRLMILAKGVPTQPTPGMTEAYLSAVSCLTRLLPLGDAADHEMLGVCQVMVGDEA